MKNKIKIKPCWCDGYWFPHRKTGGRCKFNRRLEEFLKENSKFEDKNIIEDNYVLLIDLEEMNW